MEDRAWKTLDNHEAVCFSVSQLWNIHSFCPLPCVAELRRWTETLSSASLFVCRGLLPGAVSKGSELYRIQTDSLSTHSWKQWASGQEPKPSSTSPCPLSLHGVSTNQPQFGIDTEGFSVRMSSSDERRGGFSLISYLWSNNVFKNDNLGLASVSQILYLTFIRPSPSMKLTVKPMRDWNTPGAWCVLSMC